VGVLTEDVENHRSAIDRRTTEKLFKISLLSRRQFIIEHHGVCIYRDTQFSQFLDLATS